MKFLSPIPLISLSIIALLLIAWLMAFIKNRQPAAQLALVGNTPPASTPLAAQPPAAPTATFTVAAPAKETRQANRLINEKSPYLLQHAYNPVDWYPWGEEAFAKARRENKPIFLSIGYSTCHWCHVMERESFEDPQVAQLMNNAFVSIKVDREERPDIDNIYMNAALMMNGSGGWPLTVIMTPDKKPFFVGTYIPKESRFGRLGMLELIPRVQELWAADAGKLIATGNQVLAALQQSGSGAPGQDLNEAILSTAYQTLAGRFDARNGGFGGAPKFPSPHNLLFLLRYGQRSGDPRALEMVERTLQAMRRGGVYDHVGFGFHRYSTDAQWRTPHFEKMLYDQAMLMMAYTETWQATGKAEYARTAGEIAAYVLRDMTSPQGGFYSAEDADSEGVEGKFYLWTVDEVRRIVGAEDAQLLIQVYNLSPDGNFAEEASGQKVGGNIFYQTSVVSDAIALGVSEDDLLARLETARQKLFAVREERIHPGKDDKILSDWNGLMIAALAKTGRALNNPQYTQAAARAADFTLNTMRNNKGRLLHRYRDGEAALTASIDDYAFFVWGLLELYEATFDTRYLEAALNLSDDALTHYRDAENGGFYFTPDDGEALLVRQKKGEDGAIPAGNSVMMLNLLRLGRITADARYEERAAELGRAFAGNAQQYPAAFTQLLSAVDFGLGPSYEVIIVGEPEAEDTQAMLRALRGQFIPNKIVLLRPPEEDAPIVNLAGYAKFYTALNNRATAYVCQNYVCELPTNDPQKMLEALE